MSTFDWPDAIAFRPASGELRVVDNLQRVSESQLSGYTQTLAMPGAKWSWLYEFTPHNAAQRDALEAYLLRLDGMANRVRLWDQQRPRPRGNIAISGVTLASTAAQFATTLTLRGCRPANNIVDNSSFEIDTNADGLADSWGIFSSGAVSGASSSVGALAVDGSRSQMITATSLGTSAGDYVGVRQFILASGSASAPWSAAASVRATAGSGLSVHIQFRSGGAFVGEVTSALVTANGSEQRISVAGSAPGNFDQIELQVRQSRMPAAGASSLEVDAVQLEPASAPTSYKAYATLEPGDWIGLPSQLVRCVAAAVGDYAGQMEVSVRHMLRASVPGGAAVNLDRPTALFRRTEAGIALPRSPGLAMPGFAVEFVEAFA